jgi:GNAT superfamily N-acetyltransferase
MYQITTDHNPTDEDKKTIREGIVGFNFETLGEMAKSFAVYLKDDKNNIQGGILAWLHTESVYIDVIWLEKNLRNKDFGTKLLLASEIEAIKHGCYYSTVDTYSFQAKEFYLKNGYALLGEVKNYLFQHSKIFLRKKLQP